MEEKRRFVRLNASVDIEWEKIAAEESSANIFNSTTKNISVGGICLFTSDYLEQNTPLSLTIKLPEKTINKIRGVVRWLDNFEIVGGISEKKYEIGIEFTQISDNDRNLINNFIFKRSDKVE